MVELTADGVKERIKKLLLICFDTKGDGDIHIYAADKIMLLIAKYAEEYAKQEASKAWDAAIEYNHYRGTVDKQVYLLNTFPDIK